ncbi:Zinc finger protein ZAT5 [Sesamum angolense]|uniref:Zinc finger protein ZAT5 n=1 Tax=Sesamum angolense TaxID=2727404 RepID=A0AAE1T7P2_9LAMI|nr:Zinc finger protein ZAT5 [Sesamum angolense]
MEAVEDMAAPPGRNNKDLSPIAKGKRTKRHRPHSPIPFTITPLIGDHNAPTAVADEQQLLRRSPSSRCLLRGRDTEEVDTARCLILLSRGYFLAHPSNNYHDENQPKQNNSTRRYAEAATDSAAPAYGGPPKAVGSSACIYTCKTCNRSFPSFQGGHRASHKKPKNEKRTSTAFSDEEDFLSPTMSSSKNKIPYHSLSLQLSNISSTTFSAVPKPLASPRIHECSYCGAEFTSGQALGGHMRKHRAGPIIRSSNVPPDAYIEELEPEQSKKPRTGLFLDLNLPAPEDENQKLGLGLRQQKSPEEKKETGTGLGLTTNTAPQLIDCHY